MLRAAARATTFLDGSDEPIVRFVRSRLMPDGGFRGRGDESDLYYTVFGMESLIALNAELPDEAIEKFIRSFHGGESLDLVHLACLGRCWADLPGREAPPDVREAVLKRIESCRTSSGGYFNSPGCGNDNAGSVYNGFLALGAYQDLGVSLPDAQALAGDVNVKSSAADPTPLIAAAAYLLEELGGASERREELGSRLLERCHEQGGFFAVDLMPVPDLLSTATALHALARMGVPLGERREPCLRFVTGLRTGDGGYGAVRADGVADCEYNFYGLLALGHLAP